MVVHGFRCFMETLLTRRVNRTFAGQYFERLGAIPQNSPSGRLSSFRGALVSVKGGCIPTLRVSQKCFAYGFLVFEHCLGEESTHWGGKQRGHLCVKQPHMLNKHAKHQPIRRLQAVKSCKNRGSSICLEYWISLWARLTDSLFAAATSLTSPCTLAMFFLT